MYDMERSLIHTYGTDHPGCDGYYMRSLSNYEGKPQLVEVRYKGRRGAWCYYTFGDDAEITIRRDDGVRFMPIDEYYRMLPTWDIVWSLRSPLLPSPPQKQAGKCEESQPAAEPGPPEQSATIWQIGDYAEMPGVAPIFKIVAAHIDDSGTILELDVSHWENAKGAHRVLIRADLCKRIRRAE